MAFQSRPRRRGGAGPGRRDVVSGLARGGRLFVSHVGNGTDPRVELHHGALKPRIQGWVSRAYLKCEPAPALGFSGRCDGDFAAATLFELAGPGAPPRLGLHRAPSGRLALTDGSGQGGSFAVGELSSTSCRGFSRSWRTRHARN